MRADVGDLLVAVDSERQAGTVIGVLGEEGAPPYVIKWLPDGHISMATPGPCFRIVPAPGKLPRGPLPEGDHEAT